MVSRRVQLYAMLVPNETGDFIDIKQCEELLMPSPSNTAPSRPLIFHPCQERGNSCCAHVAMLELTRQSFPWEPGGTAVLIVLLQSVVAGRVTLWPQISQDRNKKIC
jgi:hypothetical protein